MSARSDSVDLLDRSLVEWTRMFKLRATTLRLEGDDDGAAQLRDIALALERACRDLAAEGVDPATVPMRRACLGDEHLARKIAAEFQRPAGETLH